ncbi:hypothetical protein MKX01_030445 [Papaver californicum]|nr:hypothetical protein MKX01_030445 [Papaver californicum]
MGATQAECRKKEAAKVSNDIISTGRRNFSRLFLYLFNMPTACYLVEGVIISHTLVEYGVLVLLMSYLTTIFKYPLVRAEATVNIFYFITWILAIFAKLCKLRVGCYFMVLVNCISSILALVVLLKNFIPKSVQALHGALVLLAVGRGVFISTCNEELLKAQMKKANRVSNEDDEKRDDIRSRISIIRANIVGFCLSNWLLYTKKWREQFLISIYILSFTTFCLFVWKVASIMSSTSFSLLRSPEDEDDHSEHYPKAGNTERALHRNQQSGITRTSHRSAVPICFTFLMYGIVRSTGETFFQEQAVSVDTSSMGGKRSMDTSILMLQIITRTSRFFISHLVYRVLPRRSRTGTLATLIRMGFGMFFSIVTCSIAQYTEIVRLTAIKNNNLVQLQPVSFFIPQFIALGFVTGFAGEGLEVFFQNEYSNWIKSHAKAIVEVLTGIGYLLHIVLVLALRSATNKLGGVTWFADSLDTSRVDLFYHTIAVMCVLNFIPLYALASTCYYRKIKIRKFLLLGGM